MKFAQWAVCAASLSLSLGVAPAATVTAEYVPGFFSSGSSVSGFNNGSFIPGQTFTATVTGLLHEVSVGIWGNNAVNVLVEVRQTASGFPTSLLASGLITGGPYPDGTLYTADLSGAGALLTAGELYAITLRTTSASAASWSGSFGGEYSGGQFVYSTNNGGSYTAYPGAAAVFSVSVTPVPEPSAFVLLGGAVALLVARRRR